MIRKIFQKFKKERDLTTIEISKGVLILALPMIASSLLQAAYNLVDMFWVGKLGPEALAAVSMSGTVIMVLIFLMAGIAIGTTALVARSFGAKEFGAADNAAAQSLVMGFIGAAVLGVVGYIYSPWILSGLGADPAVLSLGAGYMRITFAGLIVMLFMFFTAAILQGAGDAATPMIILALSALINVFLDPLLIFGAGVFPSLGVNGAALATIIAQGIGSLIALEVLFNGRSRVHIKLKNLKFDWRTMGRILMIGIPASTQMVLRGLMGVVLVAVVAGFGTAAVAAYGVGMRLMMLAMMPGFALGGAAATMVGQNLGAKLHDRAEASVWAAVKMYFYFMLLLALIFYFFADGLMAGFNADPMVIGLGSNFLRVISFGLVFVAVGLILGRAVGGAGDTVAPMVNTFVALWLVQIPLAIWWARTPLGIDGVWWSILASQIVLVLLNTIYFQLGHWKYKKI